MKIQIRNIFQLLFWAFPIFGYSQQEFGVSYSFNRYKTYFENQVFHKCQKNGKYKCPYGCKGDYCNHEQITREGFRLHQNFQLKSSVKVKDSSWIYFTKIDTIKKDLNLIYISKLDSAKRIKASVKTSYFPIQMYNFKLNGNIISRNEDTLFLSFFPINDEQDITGKNWMKESLYKSELLRPNNKLKLSDSIKIKDSLFVQYINSMNTNEDSSNSFCYILKKDDWKNKWLGSNKKYMNIPFRYYTLNATLLPIIIYTKSGIVSKDIINFAISGYRVWGSTTIFKNKNLSNIEQSLGLGLYGAILTKSAENGNISLGFSPGVSGFVNIFNVNLVVGFGYDVINNGGAYIGIGLGLKLLNLFSPSSTFDTSVKSGN